MRDEAEDLQRARDALDVDPDEPGIQSHVTDETMTWEEAWSLYHKELERVCWMEHMQDPENDGDNRPIIPLRAMKLVFQFTWGKARESQ